MDNTKEIAENVSKDVEIKEIKPDIQPKSIEYLEKNIFNEFKQDYEKIKYEILSLKNSIQKQEIQKQEPEKKDSDNPWNTKTPNWRI